MVTSPGNYARVLFVDFTLALNTISPPLLLQKLKHLGTPDQLNKLIQSFVYHRSKRVRIGTNLYRSEHTNTGCPQGCVLSPLLFSPYTPMRYSLTLTTSECSSTQMILRYFYYVNPAILNLFIMTVSIIFLCFASRISF